MKRKSLRLTLLPEIFAVARLDPAAARPAWLDEASLFSITRTPAELSILCPEPLIPTGVVAEKGFRCFRVEGPLAFSEVGILASLAGPLAEAGVSIFVISTFDTDYLLVPADDLSLAEAALGSIDGLELEHRSDR